MGARSGAGVIYVQWAYRGHLSRVHIHLGDRKAGANVRLACGRTSPREVAFAVVERGPNPCRLCLRKAGLA